MLHEWIDLRPREPWPARINNNQASGEVFEATAVMTSERIDEAHPEQLAIKFLTCHTISCHQATQRLDVARQRLAVLGNA